MARGGRLAVVFNDAALAEDLAHATAAGRRVGGEARDRLEREGVERSELRRCQERGRDGTELGGCVKLYLPPPAGEWGMVLAPGRVGARKTALLCLAFGRRHALSPWQPSIYVVADRRLRERRGDGAS